MEGTPDLTEHIFPGAPVNVQAKQPDLSHPPNKVNTSPLRWCWPTQGSHKWHLHSRKMEWRTDKRWEFLAVGLLRENISHKLSSRQKLISLLSKGCTYCPSLSLRQVFSAAHWLKGLWVQAGKLEREKRGHMEEIFGAKLGRTVRSCWDLRCSSFWKEIDTQRGRSYKDTGQMP